MKILIILFINFLFLSNFLMAEIMPIKSKILKQSGECFKDSQNQACRDLVSQIEKLQLEVFDQNRFKCQSSLLGLQTEIIEAYFFNNSSKEKNSLMIPYVIKNC